MRLPPPGLAEELGPSLVVNIRCCPAAKRLMRIARLIEQAISVS